MGGVEHVWVVACMCGWCGACMGVASSVYGGVEHVWVWLVVYMVVWSMCECG